MTGLKNTRHIDGDACTVLDSLEVVRLHPDSRTVSYEEECWSGSLEQDDIFQFVQDGPTIWRRAIEVFQYDENTVHIKYDEAPPRG